MFNQKKYEQFIFNYNFEMAFSPIEERMEFFKFKRERKAFLKGENLV